MNAAIADFDYVIAGAGSAGCTLAARLAEDPSLKVCLVEAGGNGRENGFEGMRCFMQTKSVWLATDPRQPDPFPA